MSAGYECRLCSSLKCQWCVQSSFQLPPSGQTEKKKNNCCSLSKSIVNHSYSLSCFRLRQMFSRRMVIKSTCSNYRYPLCYILNTHTDRLRVNRFRHGGLLPCVTGARCIYADIRGECISLLCIVQLYYVNDLLLLLFSWTSACFVCVCVYTQVRRLACYIRIYILSCHFAFVINLPARILSFAAAPVSTYACEFVRLSVIAASRQGHLEWSCEMKDINNASKYWWLPLEMCVPYATLIHMINYP